MHVGENQGYRVPGPRDPTGCIEFRASSCTFWPLSLLNPGPSSTPSPPRSGPLGPPCPRCFFMLGQRRRTESYRDYRTPRAYALSLSRFPLFALDRSLSPASILLSPPDAQTNSQESLEMTLQPVVGLAVKSRRPNETNTFVEPPELHSFARSCSSSSNLRARVRACV